MKTKLVIKISIYVTCAMIAIVFLSSLIWDSINLLKWLSGVATGANVLVVLYCKLLWKFHIWKLPLSKTPNLNGEWISSITYSSGEKITKIKIKQDLFGIQVNLESDEIDSVSLVASILEEHGKRYLIYTYTTDPKQEFRDKNPVQWGTAKIDITDLNDVTGYYWTTRGTQGSMKMEKVKKQ